jgi:hypothetical protein
VQLIEQELDMVYDKCHADYARRDKIDLAWKRISRDKGVWILVKSFRNNISALV